MNKYLFSVVSLLLVTAQIYSTTDCVCSQLLSQDDCTKQSELNCSWDTSNSKCGITSTTTLTQTTTSYCDSFSQKDCPNTIGCAWVSSKCTFFTGCTPFAKTTDTDCQAVSSKCITDGTHCVEKNSCNTYLKATPCVTNAGGAFCYWDTTNNVCVDANTCDKLPSSLASDSDCRIQISTCTTKTGGGCQDSGVNCSDQITQMSCVWNKATTQACYWNSTQCVDKICANAPTTLITDDTCKAFTSDGTCTTKSGGGCITRTICSAATIQAACVINQSGSLCYWNGTTCVDKICSNAPATMTTNSACQGFISTCITTGAGCIDNGACSVATVQIACDKNSNGGACVWNTTCKDKTCVNAPSTNTTHDLCTSYLSSCTVNSGSNGCIPRTCDNAPKSIVTNENCEAYLPKSNCVAKAGGGCVTNSSCSALGQVACVKDISGNDCLWDTTCKDKTCVNAPASANTHDLCQQYLKTCTVNASGTCVTETCENIQTSDDCKIDFNGNPCIYKPKCYQLQCAQASTQTTHTACQTFSTQCTLSNSGTGCVPIPLNCSAITIQAACVFRQSPSGIANCGWNGSKCIDQDCTTVDKSNTTTYACNNVLAGCVSANPIGNAAVAGCMTLPATCSGRQTQDNCPVVGGGVTCLWNTAGSGSCVQKTCLTASVTTTPGYISTFSNSDCDGYLTGCLSNNTGDGCIAPVASCGALTTANNCNYSGAKTGGTCYWNSSNTCVDKTCTNLPLTSHSDCNGALNTCTVNAGKTNCQSFTACNKYTIQDQCHTNDSGKSCIWSGNACRDQTCADANTSNQTSSSCSSFSSLGTVLCNVVPRVQNKGCMAKLAQCSGYQEQSTCIKDSSDNSCYWQGSTCWLSSAFTCQNISLNTYTIAGCEAVKVYCTKNSQNNGCSTKVCSDYTKTDGTSTGTTPVSTDAHCSSLLSTCTIGSAACQTKQQSCSSYQSSATCTYANEGICNWSAAGTCVLPTTCTQINLTTYSASNCESILTSCTVNAGTNGCQTKVCADYSTINGLSGGTTVSADAHCSALLSTCTINNTSGAVKCQTKQAKCSSYNVSGICTYATEGTCSWNNGACVKVVTCASITNITFNAINCENSLQSCTVNSGYTACQDKTCSDYSTINGLAGGIQVSTDAQCSAINALCTIDNTQGNVKCQTKQSTCSVYTAAGNCTYATEGKCFWTGSACAKFTSCASTTLPTYSATNCEVANYSCTINTGNTACQDKMCSDYSTVNGLTDGTSLSTNAQCSALNTSCALDKSAGNAICQIKQATCSSYKAAGKCTQSTEGNCYWTGYACAKYTTCAAIALEVFNKPYNAINCEGVHYTCTVNPGKSGCVDKSCENYSTINGLTGGTQLSTNDQCLAFGTCALNLDSTSCFTMQDSCGMQNNNSCSYSIEGKCLQIATDCLIAPKECSGIHFNTSYSAADCENILTKCTMGLAGSCKYKICSDYNTINGKQEGTVISTAAQCQALDSSCTIDNTTNSVKCQTKQAQCSGYYASGTCTFATEGSCYWSGSNCYIIPTTCTQIILTTYTASNCESIQTYCTVNAGTNGCQTKVCSDYSTINGLTGGTPVSTDAHCSALLSSCIINKTLSTVKCQTKQETCSSYKVSDQCIVATEGRCYWNGTNCLKLPTTCASITLGTYDASHCEAVISTCTYKAGTQGCSVKACSDYSTQNGLTGGVAVSTDQHCASLLSTCTIDSTSGAVKCQAKQATCSLYGTVGKCTFATEGTCYWTGSACVFPSSSNCSSKTGSNLTDATCAQYNSGCTSNANGTACLTRPSTCASQSTSCIRALEGDCVQIGTACVKKTCDTAPETLTSYNDCNTYSSSCTVARTGGCITRQACNAYVSSLQCTYNASGNSCYWSVQTYACLDFTCANIDQTSSYDSHNECNDALNTCTVRAVNGAAVNGCQSFGACSSYSIKDQCHLNSSAGFCEWNTNLTPPACVDRSCESAPSSNATHAQCINHNGANSCTVGAVANGAANILGGCIALGSCSSYIDADQCHINATGGLCGWNGSVCADFSCTTSPDSNNTDSLCQTYKSGCTVDQDGSGCMSLLSTCELYLIEGNCVSDSSGNKCYWNSTTTKCVTRTCDNAPDTATTASDCNTYLAGCTIDSIKCKTKICEDFLFNTDVLCKASFSKCTTDGMKCVLRGTCYQALDQTGCVTDSSGNQCEWIPAANASAQSYCTLRTCLTSPTSNTTESQCAAYFNNCTTKNGGGCVIKSTCAAANVQAACTTASDGTKCFWDVSATPNACRNKDCQDYQGSTHATCKAINNNCSAGTNGYCARIKSCSNTTVRAACIQGTDGPCLWIAGVTNQDGSKGACFPYTSCKSLTWNTDSQCKLISSNCTTNGSNCLGITLCSETNIDGGCISGYDGNCIQTVSSLGSTDPVICKAFTQCSDAYYATHSECQAANNKCTTNGTTGCIPLAVCSTYKQAGCYVNAAGQQMANGKITSTGVCAWDNTTSVCRDQVCSDLTGTNHAACYAQLSTCTSNGTNCLTQATCSTYTQAQCNVAVGTDGVCFWQVTSATITTAVCRPMTCADVASGSTTTVCQAGLSGCVSNGASCIAKANCSTYTTKTSCNSGGLDGICVFTTSTTNGTATETGTCVLMTSCASANNDQDACVAAQLRCSWLAASKSGTTTIASKCQTHSCASYKATNNECSNFLNWSQTLQQICSLKNGICAETDPTTLSQTDCYTTSSYTYTWDTSKSKCQICGSTSSNNSSGSNNSINNTNTTTASGYVISIASIIVGFLVF